MEVKTAWCPVAKNPTNPMRTSGTISVNDGRTMMDVVDDASNAPGLVPEFANDRLMTIASRRVSINSIYAK